MSIKLGDKLRIARKMAGYRQDDIADKLNIQRQAISMWECNRNAPTRDNLEKLAEIYNVDIDYLKQDVMTLGTLIEHRLFEEYGVSNLTEFEKRHICEKIIKMYDLVR